MRKNTKIVKPISVIEAKKKADHFDNLAKSAVKSLNETIEEEKKVLESIEALLANKKKEEEELFAEKGKISSARTKRLELNKINDSLERDLVVLGEKIKSKQVEVDSLDERMAAGVIEMTLDAEAKNVALHKKIVATDRELSSLTTQSKEAQTYLTSVNDDINVKEAILAKLNEDIESLVGTRITLTEKIDIYSDKISSMEKETSVLSERTEHLKEVERLTVLAQSDLLALQKSIEEKSLEYDSFAEKMDKKIEAFKVVEARIDVKTRRIKKIADEKGIEKYLAEKDIK